MSTENEALVRRFFDEVCNERRLDVADKIFAADHTYHDPQIPDVEPGPKGMADTMATYQNAFSNAHWTVDQMISTDDYVTTRWVGRGTHDAELEGIPPTGKDVTVPGIWIHRIANGKIAESWNNWDTLGFMQQLGVIPSEVAAEA